MRKAYTMSLILLCKIVFFKLCSSVVHSPGRPPTRKTAAHHRRKEDRYAQFQRRPEAGSPGPRSHRPQAERKFPRPAHIRPNNLLPHRGGEARSAILWASRKPIFFRFPGQRSRPLPLRKRDRSCFQSCRKHNQGAKLWPQTALSNPRNQ